jgi:hypothetical protein
MSSQSPRRGRAPGPILRPRSLPEGLFLCPTCRTVRGRTHDGRLSVCLCQGLRCNGCGGMVRRPITDYFDADSRSFVHVPWFAAFAHRCPTPPKGPMGERFTSTPPDDDVREYQERVTRAALAEMAERAARRSDADRRSSPTERPSRRRSDDA